LTRYELSRRNFHDGRRWGRNSWPRGSRARAWSLPDTCQSVDLFESPRASARRWTRQRSERLHERRVAGNASNSALERVTRGGVARAFSRTDCEIGPAVLWRERLGLFESREPRSVSCRPNPRSTATVEPRGTAGAVEDGAPTAGTFDIPSGQPGSRLRQRIAGRPALATRARSSASFAASAVSPVSRSLRAPARPYRRSHSRACDGPATEQPHAASLQGIPGGGTTGGEHCRDSRVVVP
jgi:hypothetical protein